MLQQAGLILQYCFLVYLTLQVVYLLFFSLAGKFVHVKPLQYAQTLRRMRILVPAYKEDAVIIATAKNAVSQNYPSGLFEVLIIADSCSHDTLDTLRSLPVGVLEVSFDKSTKGKALQKAIEFTFHDPVDVVVVIDADNHMAPGFLHAVNDAFEQGYEVVQGHRTAMNFQTSFAFLDACTEEINNHIFRRGHVAVGLPSALIGSGMAFDWDLFVNLLQDIGETSGEDKELEFRIVRQRKKVAFLDGKFVYDEKVATPGVFSKQRSRWLATQLEFFEKYSIEGLVQLFKGNIAFFNKVFQTWLLPRVMLVAVLLAWLVWVVIFSPQFIWFSLGLLIALAGALLMGIPSRWYNKKLFFAILQIPGALLSMLKAMMHIGRARKQFIHTPHGETELKSN